MYRYSIIIPVYNAEKTLEECVSSILQQHVSDFEILLVEDRSADNSFNICCQLQETDKRIKVFRQEANRGVSAARNRGIKEAKGQYVLFVDSDDFVADNYLCTINELVGKRDFDFYAFGHKDYIILKDAEVQIQNSFMNCSVEAINPGAQEWKNLFLQSFFASPCNKVYKREVIEKNVIRFDESCVCYEDYLFNVEYCKHVKSFCVIETPLYYYRQYDNMKHVTKRKWGERFEVSKKVADATESFITCKGEEDKLSQIRRHVYQSYKVELEASYMLDDDFNEVTKKLMYTPEFVAVVNSIKPAGVKLSLLKILIKLHITMLGIKVIQNIMHIQ